MKKKFFSISLVVVFVAFLLPLFLVKKCGVDFEKLGQYGDFFGSFNALVSLLAFGGLIYTIHLQRKDLELQREELKLTREELKRQAEAQETAAKEQANQVKLLEDQINKDIRPYINAYIDFQSGLYLVIKNIGKSTCRKFSTTISFDENLNEKQALAYLKQKLETIVSFALIPAGVEFFIPLGDKNLDYRHVLALKTPLIARFQFEYKGRTESFENLLQFNEIRSHGDRLNRNLKNISSSIDGLRSELNSIASRIR
jgi:uncharacterized protein (DUF2225 family)